MFYSSPKDVARSSVACHVAHQDSLLNMRLLIDQSARNTGLKVRGSTRADGNCMFHAIADQLERIQAVQRYTHSELRIMQAVQRYTHSELRIMQAVQRYTHSELRIQAVQRYTHSELRIMAVFRPYTHSVTNTNYCEIYTQ